MGLDFAGAEGRQCLGTIDNTIIANGKQVNGGIIKAEGAGISSGHSEKDWIM